MYIISATAVKQLLRCVPAYSILDFHRRSSTCFLRGSWRPPYSCFRGPNGYSMRGIASLSRIITRGQTSAEVVEHSQTQTQTLRVADVHTNSKPLHASFISLLYSIPGAASPHLPCCVSFGCFVPVVSGVVLGLVLKLLAPFCCVAGRISCQSGSHPTAKAYSFALEQWTHPSRESESVK